MNTSAQKQRAECKIDTVKLAKWLCDFNWQSRSNHLAWAGYTPSFCPLPYVFFTWIIFCRCILSWWNSWLKTWAGNQGFNYCGLLKRKRYSAAWQLVPHLLAGIDEHKCLSVSVLKSGCLMLPEYWASSHQCCSWRHLDCGKEVSNNRQLNVMILSCDDSSGWVLETKH